MYRLAWLAAIMAAVPIASGSTGMQSVAPPNCSGHGSCVFNADTATTVDGSLNCSGCSSCKVLGMLTVAQDLNCSGQGGADVKGSLTVEGSLNCSGQASCQAVGGGMIAVQGDVHCSGQASCRGLTLAPTSRMHCSGSGACKGITGGACCDGPSCPAGLPSCRDIS